MVYSIQVARIGRHGFSIGPPTELTAPSEREAIAALRWEIARAHARMQPTRFSLYGPDDHLLLSYTSEDRPAPPLDPARL